MTTVLLVIHIMIAIALIAVVLLQRSEGGALGIGGGGGGFMTGRERRQRADQDHGGACRGLLRHQPDAHASREEHRHADLDLQPGRNPGSGWRRVAARPRAPVDAEASFRRGSPSGTRGTSRPRRTSGPAVEITTANSLQLNVA